jgi:AraC-like DNA-binding protein
MMTDPEPALLQSIFSTDPLAPEQRFDGWRSALASSHAIEASPDGFFGRVHSVQAGSIVVHCLDSAPVALERSATRIRQDGLDHFVLHLSRHPIQAQAAGRALDIAAGNFSVNDLSQPTVRRSAAETASLVAVIPRGLMREAMGDCDTLHGQVLDPGAGVLLASHLSNLIVMAGEIPAAAGPALARATAYLAAACLNPTPRAFGQAAPAIQAAKCTRACAFIDANLARSDLTPETIGRAVGLSRSALFRAFEPLGGVSAYLWSRRLEAVHRALQDADESRSIGELGFAYGFTSGAHLSRAFRRAFGQSPSDLRHSVRAAGRFSSP